MFWRSGTILVRTSPGTRPLDILKEVKFYHQPKSGVHHSHSDTSIEYDKQIKHVYRSLSSRVAPWLMVKWGKGCKTG